MRYEIDPDDPASGQRSLQDLKKAIRGLAPKDRERIATLFQHAEQFGLAVLSESARDRIYLWETTQKAHRIYRCKIRCQNRVHFRFFFLERVRSGELTTYYLLHAYSKKTEADGNEVERLVRNRAMSLTEDW